MREGMIPRRLAGVGTLGLVLGLLLLVSGVVPAGATHVAPIVQSGNPDCGDQGLSHFTKFDSQELPSEGGPTVSQEKDGETVTVTGTEFGDGGELLKFDWTATFDVDAVIVKGGPNANVYLYSGSSDFSDQGLTAPINPATGEPYAVSHITFCFDTFDETTTTTEVEDTTTTTAAVEVLPTVVTTSTTVVVVEAAQVTTAAVAETLPFTGPAGGSLAGLGAGLVTMGGLMLATVRWRKRWAE